MVVDFSDLVNSGLTVGVAVSGGGDSMALLHYLNNASKTNGFNVVAINVEHGIRGEASLKDTAFVKDYCSNKNIELICYSVNSLEKAKKENLSVEQAARILRYQCFLDCIENGKCDKVATAHHAGDNAESVLFNLFRGTGLKGLSGIKAEREDGIIRPLVKLSKQEIERYLKDNNIPFVTDETNLSCDYTRNFIRLNVLPKIKEIFPEAEKSINRFSEIAELENDYLDLQSENIISRLADCAKIAIPAHKAVFSRAVIKALQHLGIEKDWEKTHVDDVYALSLNQNGSQVHLPKNVIAVKEYESVVLYKNKSTLAQETPFCLGEINFNDQVLHVEKIQGKVDLKSGLYADLDKIPKGAIIRTKKDGDVFKKFGGGTKSLGDFFTDKKLPKRLRDETPLIAVQNQVLAIFGLAVSDLIKVDEKTISVIKIKI